LGDRPASEGAHDAVNLDVIVAERLQALLNAPHRLISRAAERGGLELRNIGLHRWSRRGRRRGAGRLRSLQTELAQQCRVAVWPPLEANDTPLCLARRTRLRAVHSVYLTTVETQLAEHGLNGANGFVTRRLRNRTGRFRHRADSGGSHLLLARCDFANFPPWRDRWKRRLRFRFSLHRGNRRAAGGDESIRMHLRLIEERVGRDEGQR